MIEVHTGLWIGGQTDYEQRVRHEQNGRVVHARMPRATTAPPSANRVALHRRPTASTWSHRVVTVGDDGPRTRRLGPQPGLPHAPSRPPLRTNAVGGTGIDGSMTTS